MAQKYVSIMGDSISTYAGYNPEGYAVYYDSFAIEANGMRSVGDTWWSIVLKEINVKLCVNGSYSGSRVSGAVFPAAESAERVKALANENTNPGMILVYMGFNDFAGTVYKKEFLDAYQHMLERLKSQYPESDILCGTLMRTYVKDTPEWLFPDVNRGVRIDDYSEAIRKACDSTGVLVADVEKTGIAYETLDGAHPTVTGHAEIARAWNRCLKEILSRIEMQQGFRSKKP